MITLNIKHKKQNTIFSKNDCFKKTTTLLRNRLEFFKNKEKNYIYKKKININHKSINFNKKINLISEYFFYQSKMLQEKKNTVILKKIQKIDPWYREICKLKKIPKIVQQLAIHTSYKNTSKYWYILLQEKNKHLMQYNTWFMFQKELNTITEKKIQLIIYKSNILKIFTPYEWFKKIYKEKILKEYLLLIKDPNVQFLKQYFHAKLNEKNIVLTSCS